MSDNNGDAKMQLTCPNCGQKWSIALPPAEIANNPRCSVVTVAHENLIRCINNKCRTPFIIVIGQIQIAFQVVPVGDDIVRQIEGTTIVRPLLTLQ